MVAAAYTFADKRTEEIVNRRIQQWVSKISIEFAEGAAGTTYFDFSEWAAYLTYDIMGEVVGSLDLGCVRGGFDASGLTKGFKAGLPAFGFVTRMHVLAGWVRWSWMGRFFEWWVPKDNTVGVLMRFGRKLLLDRANDNFERRDDMVQRYVSVTRSVLS